MEFDSEGSRKLTFLLHCIIVVTWLYNIKRILLCENELFGCIAD